MRHEIADLLPAILNLGTFSWALFWPAPGPRGERDPALLRAIVDRAVTFLAVSALAWLSWLSLAVARP